MRGGVAGGRRSGKRERCCKIRKSHTQLVNYSYKYRHLRLPCF